MLQRARDEAHRFAITYNRKLRTKRTVRSELSEVPGVGPARQRALLGRFGSLRAVAQATEAEVAELAGFSAPLARAVVAFARSRITTVGTTAGRHETNQSGASPE